MHWVRVGDYALPKRIGGDPGLEFCNTWAGWSGTHRWSADAPLDRKREWLPDYDRFAVWAGYVELLPEHTVARTRAAARDAPAAAGAVLHRAHRLRDQLYWVFTDPGDADAFAGFARTAQAAARASVLTAGGDGVVRRVLPDGVGLALPLLAVARAAEALLADPDRDPVRACPGEDCGWLFLDRRGRRRWCDMGSCGNRAKARAHAARHRD